MVVGVPHDETFVEEWHTHAECPVTWPRIRGFECYAFKSGTFQLKADGGMRIGAFWGTSSGLMGIELSSTTLTVKQRLNLRFKILTMMKQPRGLLRRQ